MSEAFQPYSSALLALSLLVLIVAIQSFSSTFVNSIKREAPPGMPIEGNYADKHWRMHRVHMNSIENFGIFAAALFAAVLLGANAGLVATIAWIHVVARLAHWICYQQSIGAQAGGPRTISFVIGFFSTVALALVAVLATLL